MIWGYATASWNIVVISCCFCEYAVHSNYYLLHFHLLYFTYTWDCKQVNWDTNSIIAIIIWTLREKQIIFL